MVPHATKVKSPCHNVLHGDPACVHIHGTLPVARRSLQQSSPRRARGRPCSLPGAPPERAKLMIAVLRAPAGSSAAEGTRAVTMRVAFRKSVDSRCTWARRPTRRPSSAQGPPGFARPYARRGQAPAARRTATAPQPSCSCMAFVKVKMTISTGCPISGWQAPGRAARLQLAALGGDGAACPGCQRGALPARIRRVRTCRGAVGRVDRRPPDPSDHRLHATRLQAGSKAGRKARTARRAPPAPIWATPQPYPSGAVEEGDILYKHMASAQVLTIPRYSQPCRPCRCRQARGLAAERGRARAPARVRDRHQALAEPRRLPCVCLAVDMQHEQPPSGLLILQQHQRGLAHLRPPQHSCMTHGRRAWECARCANGSRCSPCPSCACPCPPRK